MILEPALRQPVQSALSLLASILRTFALPLSIVYSPLRHAHRLIVLILALACLCCLGYSIARGRPQSIVDAPAGHIACVSYAPYRKPGETPFDPGARVSEARIEEDLSALSRRFDCVRTYSVGAGLDQVPAVARRHHMRVYLGLWLSRNEIDNAKEIALGIDVAQRNRDVVRAVIVGNEVLLRGELTQTALAQHIRDVGAATGLPVTYADVWEFWLKYREVEKAVSFVTIHILPYWEDEPVSIGDAVAHVQQIRAQMQAAFPDRDILIGETGWPSQGRQRRGAVPNLVNEARFTREFLQWAQGAHINYNVIEAFDQPWKRALEGTVGGYWGMYDAALQEKFPLQGPVVEDPDWWRIVLAGLLGAVLVLCAGTRAALTTWLGRSVLASSGYVGGSLLAVEWHHMPLANRDTREWLLTGGLWLVAACTAILAARALASQVCAPSPTGLVASLSEMRDRTISRAARALGGVRFFWLFVIAVMDVLLIFDARYRDFPSALVLPAVSSFILLSLIPGASRRAALEERVLGYWLVCASVIVVALELPSNTSADLWAALGVVSALSVLLPRRRRAAH